MIEADPDKTSANLAVAIIQRAVEDARLMRRHGIIVDGKANTSHAIFTRIKRQFVTEAWQGNIEAANPRDVYDLIRFFDDGIKLFLKIAGVKTDHTAIKRRVFGLNL